jgi:hypothetical protein
MEGQPSVQQCHGLRHFPSRVAICRKGKVASLSIIFNAVHVTGIRKKVCESLETEYCSALDRDDKSSDRLLENIINLRQTVNFKWDLVTSQILQVTVGMFSIWTWSDCY